MEGLALTIPLARNCPLDGLVLYEPVDTNLLDKCIHSDLLIESYTNKNGYVCNERIQLEKYALNISRNLARVEYQRTEGYAIGRVNPVGLIGLHSIPRKTRHTLVKGRMTDVDIENAHNVFLVQILQHNQYQGSFVGLMDYCDNREVWRKEIADAYDLTNNEKVLENEATPKEISKDLIIRVLYGGSVAKWKKKWNITEGTLPTKVSHLQKELKAIHAYICEKNPELYEFCKKNNIAKGKDYNHEGTTCSWFLQDKECLILECVYQYCVDNDYIKDDICSLCNDGIMLQTKYYDPKLLTELHQVVQEQLGFRLRFEEKQMNEDYLDILDSHLKFDLWKLPITDGLYADYFKLLYHNKFVCKNGYSYCFNGVYWEKDEERKHVRISSQVDNQFKTYIIQRSFSVKKSIRNDLTNYEEKKCLNNKENIATSPDEVLGTLKAKYPVSTAAPPPQFKGDVVVFFLEQVIKWVDNYIKSVEKYLRSVNTRDRLVKDICRVCDADWIQFDMDEFLLAFLNKIYDLGRGVWVKPHYTQYISLTTGWKWVSGYNTKYRRVLMELLEQIHTDEAVREHYLTVLATGIYGKVIQHFFVAKGIGGNGKSVINSLMMRCVGKYGYKLPSTAVSQVIKEGANPTIANVHNKRFGLVQEPDKKHKVVTSTIKEMTGDKELNCRTLYSTDTYTRLVVTLLMECNDLPQLDDSGNGTGRRLDVIPFDSKFLTHTQWENRTEEEVNSDRVFKANPYYTSDGFQDTYKQALMEILMERFSKFQSDNFILKPPKAVVKEADEYLKYSDDFYGWWNDRYVPCVGSIIPFKHIWSNFSFSDYYNNMSKKEKRRYNQSKLKETISSNTFLKDKFYKNGRSYEGKAITCDSICGYEVREQEHSHDEVEEEEVEEEEGEV